MKKLILKNGYSPGDIVMLTAAVRDLHRCYPGQFATDVRTPCAELWEHNPHITPLSETDPDVEILECTYPLIDRCNDTPHHCLHGFIEFLNGRLRLAIKPTSFKGDIHLSDQERVWYSQVHELTGEDATFWIIVSGGKYDVTVKWWDPRRYQQVVDHFRGRIQFVQVGDLGHHHPRLKGVIDLRGQTNLRELVRLVYHAQGVLCPVTALMHLAAAVDTKPGRPALRPCVVVAGGREPAHWEAYPGHQFIHTIGSLPCCQQGGCWRDRAVPLGDGNERDNVEHLCADPVDGLPHCLAMITAQDVIGRIQSYFDGGVLSYLTPRQVRASRRGVCASLANCFDDAPLTLSGARLACDAFITAIPPYPDTFRSRGVAICGGGINYFTCAWVCIHMLRRMGCSLPIQLWYLDRDEFDHEMEALLRPLDVECIAASQVRKRHPIRRLGGWELKPYALVHCPFQEVLLLDADNVAVVNPEFLFESPQFRQTGALFWPDFGQLEKSRVIWDSCGLARPPHPEFESGQMVLDKKRCWAALQLTLWFNAHSDFYYRHLHGDKETYHLAFRKLGQPFSLVDTPVHPLEGTMCQHDFEGRRLFQHRNTDKWDLFLRNRRVADFWYEQECREDVARLQTLWDGRMHRYRPQRSPRPSRRDTIPPRIVTCLISCAGRESLREQTLVSLAATDWDGEPVLMQIDPGVGADRRERQTHNALLALRRSLDTNADYVLFLEDDLDFNRHLRHNLQHWRPLQNGEVALAGLYNPNLPFLAGDVQGHACVVAPHRVFGSQAFLLSKSAVKYLVQHWSEVEGMQDIKMSRLAGRLKRPLFYHVPSLVQHVGTESLWGGRFHQAKDFDPDWKA